MANPKDKDQQVQEIQSLEIQGVLNPSELPMDRYTNTILGESAGTDFTQQTLASLIRRDKNRLQFVQNRTCLVIDKQQLSTYEDILYNIARPNNNDAVQAQKMTKVLTRNAESRTYFLSPPWAFSDDPMNVYEASIMRDLHTYAIEIDNDEMEKGAFFKQIYEDHSQTKAQLVNKIKQGVKSFPKLRSAKKIFLQPPGKERDSLYVATPDNDPSNLVTRPNTTIPGKALNPDKDGILKMVLDSSWSPVYNPCAILAGTKQRPTAKVGKNRTSPDDPVNKTTRGSDFGPRIRPNYGTVQFHDGQDMYIANTVGYPIVAVADGVVKRIKMNGRDSTGEEQPITTGNCYVVIAHHKAKTYPEELKKKKIEIHTVYMHLVRIPDSPPSTPDPNVSNPKTFERLQPGDEVRAGQIIGFMGGVEDWPGSGNTTGAHLHFEIGVRQLKNGKYRYDTYTIKKEDGSGEVLLSHSAGDLGLGAVDPLSFKYPNLKSFSKEALAEIKTFLPVTAESFQQILEREARAKEEREDVLTGSGRR